MLKAFFKRLQFLLWLLPVGAAAQTTTSCFEVQSILVDACGNAEAHNEMVYFITGPNALNTADLTISWATAANGWAGICKNAATAQHVTTLNASIQSCGYLIEPENGVLPANKKILLITGISAFDPAANSFANLADTLYVIFHCPNNAPTTSGNFANRTGSPGPRTFRMGFSGSTGCSSKNYVYRTELLTQYPNQTNVNNGATVNFDPEGNPSYLNNGCVAPFKPLSPAWTAPETVCQNDSPINLNTLVTGTPGGSWEGPGVSDTVFTPVGLNGPVEISYKVNRGSCEVEERHTITLSEAGDAAWNAPAALCQDDTPINLNTLVTGTPGGSWSGPGLSGSVLNPAGLNGPVVIRYSVGTGNCAAQQEHTITVSATGNASWNAPATVCREDSPIDLNTLLTGTPGGSWEGDGVSGSIFNPAGLNGAVVIRYKVGSGSCEVRQEHTITVSGAGDAAWEGPSPVCASEGIIDLSAWVSGSSDGTWSGQNVSGSNWNVSSLNGTYELTYAITGSSCPDALSREITVINLPPLTPEGTQHYCPGETMQPLESNALPGSEVSWYTDPDLTQLAGTGSSFIPPAETATYYVVQSASGCRSPATSIPIEIDPVSAHFIAEPDSGAAPLMIAVTDNSAGAVECAWYLGDSLITTPPSSLVFAEPGEYVLTQRCSSATGCQDQVSVTTVVVSDVFMLEVPNVFSPNGDLLNPLFQVQHNAVKTFEAHVYSRWGKELFTWNNVAAGWDGTVNGERVPDGVYFYVISGTDIHDKTFNKQGTVQVIGSN